MSRNQPRTEESGTLSEWEVKMFQRLIKSNEAMFACAKRCMRELDIIESIVAHDLRESHYELSLALEGMPSCEY